MCWRCNKADFERHMRKEKRTVRQHISEMKQSVISSNCCADCFTIKDLMLEIQLYESILELLITGSCNVPLDATCKKLNDLSQEVLDEMLLENKCPGVSFKSAKGMITFADAPGECVRLQADCMLSYSKHYEMEIDHAYELVQLHALYSKEITT